MTGPNCKLPYSADIDWYLTQSDAALGIRSSLATLMASLERNGAVVTPNKDPYNDLQLGWGETWKRGLEGTFEKHRRLHRLWLKLEPEHQRVLSVHYLGSMLTQHQQKDEETQEEPESRFTLHDKRPPRAKKRRHKYHWAKWPVGVEGQLGQCAGVALMLAESQGRLKATLKLCAAGKKKDLAGLVKRAEAAIEAAHRAFSELKDDDGLRKMGCGNG